jgi:hypothetical protein
MHPHVSAGEERRGSLRRNDASAYVRRSAFAVGRRGCAFSNSLIRTPRQDFTHSSGKQIPRRGPNATNPPEDRESTANIGRVPKMPSADDLIEWLEHMGTLLDEGSISMQEADRDRFVVLVGLALQSIRFGGAYARLWWEGFEREGAAVGRGALEHAVTAQWVIHHGDDGLSRLQASYRKKALEFYTNMAGYLDDDELASQAATNLHEARPGLPKLRPCSATSTRPTLFALAITRCLSSPT